jgi:two-component system, response regulator
MNDRVILLIEDNPDDEALTLRALRKNHIGNTVVVARDGAEALDYVFGTGAYAGRNPAIAPAVVLLDLKLPKLDGLEVLRRIRADERTRLYPVVILTSSIEDIDLLNGYSRGANSYIRKPVDFEQFVKAVGDLGLYWLVLNEPPPSSTRRPTA